MRIEIRKKEGQDSMDALGKVLKILKKKTAGDLRLVRERNRGFVKPSQLRHNKVRDILHKRKLKKMRRKTWKK